MKTSSRLTLACGALALLLTSFVIYAAPANSPSASAGAQTANARTRRKTKRKRRARKIAPVVSSQEVPAASSGGTPGVYIAPAPVDSDEPPAPPTPAPTPKRVIISGGVLNGKATTKPQPAYPAIARAARASGTVVVQIVVDEEGKVISASAVSGHPLLQASAVAAARQARFEPTLLDGQPVKVSGVITYNFVLQ